MLGRRTLIWTTALTLAALLLGIAGAQVAPAAPVAVAADAGLWQTDGRVNAVTYSPDGGTLYIGGIFHHLCPPAQATCTGAGNDDIAIDYLAALDATTGAPITSWRPQPNNEVLSLALSSSGVLYAGGLFTTVSGQKHRKLAAIGTTGTAIASWKPVVNATVKTLALSPDESVLYLGGSFSTVDTAARPLLAAVSTYAPTRTTQVLQPWSPAPSGTATIDKGVSVAPIVNSLAVRPDGQVFAAGVFTSIGGVARGNVAALTPATDGGSGAAAEGFTPPNLDYIVLNLTLTRDGSSVFVNGRGPGGFIWALDSSSGTRMWVRNFDGDVQAAVATDTLVYVGGHFDYVTLPGSAVRDVRHHIAALDTLTGRTDPWNPAANSAQGVYALGWAPSHIAAGGDFNTFDKVAHNGVAQFSGGSTSAPSTVTDLSAASTAKGRVDLSWTASDDADSTTLTYRLYRRAVGGTFAGLTTVSGLSSSGGGGTITYADTTGTIGTDYEYLVRAADPVFLSAAGNVAGPVTVAPDQDPPAAPTGVVASAVSKGNALVSWTGGGDADDTSIAYTVNRISGDTVTPVATVNGAPAGTVTYTDSIADGGTFSYSVQASDTAASSAVSDPSAAVTVLPDIGQPSVPPSLKVTSPFPNKVVLSWKASTDSDHPASQLSYVISRRLSSATGSGTVIGRTAPGVLTFSETSDGVIAPLPDKTYTYTVSSTDGPYTSAPTAGITVFVTSSVFTDDLTTLGAWTTPANVSGITLDALAGHTAAPSAKLIGKTGTNKLTAYANRTLGAGYRTACVREWVSVAAYDPSSLGATTLIRFMSTKGNSISRIYLDRLGQLWIRSDWASSAFLTQAVIPADGSWHSVQLCTTVVSADPTSGAMSVYYDGARVGNLSGIDNGADPLNTVDMGERGTGNFTFSVDDVTAGTTPRF
jgi:hypothetical protein